MMEFTYDGMVRWGFGFANPNHAAAFICALLPFFWGWKKYPRTGLLLSIPLFLGLLLTFSRTGLAVAFFELATFYILSRNRNWKSFCTILCCLTAAAALTGVLARFALDKSVTNRPEIWFAGLRLYANNPWGVGTGNSGRIVSAFLLPDAIQCRTLVSSHLTLLTEWGWLAGFCWFGVLFYTLVRGIRHPAVWCSLAGLAISAGMSSFFDAGTLFDFRPDRANFWLSWTVLLFYFTLLGIALWGKFHWRSGVVAVVGAGLICVGGGLFRSKIAPRVEQEYLVLQGKDRAFLVYGDRKSTRLNSSHLP